MNEEIKPLYIPADSGNAMPNLNKHPAHNETPIPLHRTRTEPSRAMTDSPQKYLLPGGAELRDIIKRRIDATSQSTKALCAALARAYQIRGGHYEAVMNEIATMINSGDLAQRDGELHIAEPPVTEIPAEMWTMTHTQRLMHVLGDEPQTRAALARQTGLKPRQVSKAAYLLIKDGKAEVVGDVPRTWRRTTVTTELGDKSRSSVRQGPDTELGKFWADHVNTEPQKMDADDVCKAVLERLGDKVYPADNVVIEIIRQSDWARDEAVTLMHDMLGAGYLIRQPDGTLRQPKPEPETAVLTEEQTRAVVLDRALCACPEGVLIEDVARMSGWKRDTVAALLETMLRDGELTRLDDMRIGLPIVKSEDPPAYEIGDDDDGEIPEPGIGRPEARPYVLDSATIDFVQRDSGGYVADECSVTIDAAGLSFGGGDVMPFAAIDALMPTLKRVHRALFGDGDEAV